MNKKSMATKSMTKIDRYGWSALDERCTYKRIPISQLNVGEYQRGEVCQQVTCAKAAHYTNAAAGAVIVAQRKDGTFWLVDGLQRKLAAERRSDITHLDCMVFQSKGEAHEAQVFLLCNKGRVAVSAMHKFHASVRAGLDPEATINKWAQDHGFVIADAHSTKGRVIRFATSLVRAWEMDASICKQSLHIVNRICDGEMNKYIFEGVMLLLRKGVDVDGEVNKIRSMGGQTRLLKEINTAAILLGKSKTWTTCAVGVLNVINHKRRNRIHVEF